MPRRACAPRSPSRSRRAPRCWRCRWRSRDDRTRREADLRARRSPCSPATRVSRGPAFRDVRARARTHAPRLRRASRRRTSTNRPDPGVWPTRGPDRGRSRPASIVRRRSRREAYLRRHPRDVDAAHPLGAERDQALARGGRVGDERVDLDPLTSRRERAEALDAFVEQRGCAVEVAVAPVMKAHADLQDPVVEAADRRARVAPQQLERLVLLEELAGVELLDASDQLRRSGLVAPRARGLFDRTTGDALRPPRRLAVAATRLRRAPARRSCGSGAHLRGTRARVGSRTLSGARPPGRRTRP